MVCQVSDIADGWDVQSRDLRDDLGEGRDECRVGRRFEHDETPKEVVESHHLHLFDELSSDHDCLLLFFCASQDAS